MPHRLYLVFLHARRQSIEPAKLLHGSDNAPDRSPIAPANIADGQHA
jgi:hypothetical protein